MPLHRAESVQDVSVYWLPVYRYPMPLAQTQWVLELGQRLDVEWAKQKLHPEFFLQFKSLFPDLLDRFTETAQEYQPFTGVSLQPGEGPPAPLTIEALEAEIKKGGPVDVKQWMMNYCHWFLTKQTQQQRTDFFGVGGTCTIWVPEGTATPAMEIPRIVRTHPLFKQSNAEQKMAGLYSLQDPFLSELKEIFGGPLRSEPGYPGMLFVLPLFTSALLIGSSPEQREQWFSIFAGYMIESVVDGGVLLAVRDPHFDETLITILDQMRADGLNYPTMQTPESNSI